MPTLRYLRRADFPLPPAEHLLLKRERIRIFVRQHFLCLRLAPAMLRREHAGPEDVEETVHLRPDTVVKLKDGMMQARRKLDRHAMPRRGDKGACDLHAGRESVRGQTTGAEFETHA